MTERHVQPLFKTYREKPEPKRLRQVGRKAKREQKALDEFRAVLRARSNGLCEIDHNRAEVCTNLGPHAGTDAHHRCPADRDRGVHDPERGLFLCATAHRWVHHHPALSYSMGWLLRDGGGAA